MSEIFKNIPTIKYEGKDTQNPFAFRYYAADKVIMGKKMSEHLPFAMAWWHNLCAAGTDMFGRDTENRGKQNMNSLLDGFRQRWEYMRKLFNTKHIPISDKDFDSLNVTFNINKPVDTKQDFENMKIQYEIGALSKRTIS